MDLHHIMLVFLMLLLTQCSNHMVRCVITDVQLVGGPTSNKGTVEIRIDYGIWETTCGVNLDVKDVTVICKQLGFTGANKAIQNTLYGQNSTPTRGLNCKGGEAELSQCTLFQSSCLSTPRAGAASCHGGGYLGCFKDVSTDRALDGDTLFQDPNMSISFCIQFCSKSTMSHYTYAGVENGNECFCGKASDNYNKHGVRSDAMCSSTCSGDNTDSCGGVGYIAVFTIPMFTPTTVSTPKSPTSIDHTPSKSTSDLSSTNQVMITNNGDMSATSSLSTTFMAPQATYALPLSGNSTAIYGGIGGGVAAFVIVIIIAIIFFIGRRSRKGRNDPTSSQRMSLDTTSTPTGINGLDITNAAFETAATVQNNSSRLSVVYAMPDKNGNEPRNEYEVITNEMAPYASVDNVSPMRPRTMPKKNDRLSVVYAAPDKSDNGPRNDTSEDFGNLYAMPDNPRGQLDGKDDGIVHGLYATADDSFSGDQYEPEDMVENELYTI